MKIIICVSNLFGGGAERVASLWANGFSQQGHEVILFLAEDIITYDVQNLQTIIIGNDKNFVFQYWKWYCLFRREFRRLKPDVFISVNHPWAIIAKLASKDRMMQVISTEHNAFEKPSNVRMGVSDWLHKFFFNRFVNKVTVLTNSDKEYIGNRLDNVYVLPNPLAMKPISEPVKKQNVILAVGRLNSWYVKGFDVLIKCWGTIAKRFPEWKLRIIGYGSEDDIYYLNNLASNIDNSQFEILNFDKNIVRHYLSSSIFVLSSRYEGFGMVLIEAMSQGCGCIACDYKGRQKEIINDEIDGIIIEPNDEEALKTSMVRLIEDNNFRSNLQKNAVERSKQFELQNIMSKWDLILGE